MRCYCKLICITCKDLAPQWGSLCQDLADNWTTWRPDHCKEMQTEVVWIYLLFIRSGQNHLLGHSEMGKKTRQTEKEVGRQHQGMDGPDVRKVPKGSGEQGENGGNRLWSHPWFSNDPSRLRDRWRWSHVTTQLKRPRKDKKNVTAARRPWSVSWGCHTGTVVRVSLPSGWEILHTPLVKCLI